MRDDRVDRDHQADHENRHPAGAAQRLKDDRPVHERQRLRVQWRGVFPALIEDRVALVSEVRRDHERGERQQGVVPRQASLRRLGEREDEEHQRDQQRQHHVEVLGLEQDIRMEYVAEAEDHVRGQEHRAGRADQHAQSNQRRRGAVALQLDGLDRLLACGHVQGRHESALRVRLSRGEKRAGTRPALRVLAVQLYSKTTAMPAFLSAAARTFSHSVANWSSATCLPCMPFQASASTPCRFTTAALCVSCAAVQTPFSL